MRVCVLRLFLFCFLLYNNRWLYFFFISSGEVVFMNVLIFNLYLFLFLSIVFMILIVI